MSVKYIFITGGVVSGLGKGITAASLGRLLKNRGYGVTIKKFDPYINVDSGTMNPYQHGEVFVTNDGAETDLDLGHYERFIDKDLFKDSNVTTGKLYWNVINKERNGDFLGATVQVIPHITDEIKDNIYNIKHEEETKDNIVIIEIGGTVGDIESQPFLEAIRQIGVEKMGDVLYIHLTLIPTVPGSLELKSKPTQHSVKELLSLGIQPNIIVCRSDYKINRSTLEKISLFCNVKKEDVIENLTASSIYEVPILLENSGLCRRVCKNLNLEEKEPNNKKWEEMLNRQKSAEKEVIIGLVGKYVKLLDAYISVVEALNHGGIYNDARVKIKYINSENFKDVGYEESLAECDGILIPGGFGDRGIEGMIKAAKYCRENKKPCFGICLGMQIMVIEYFRNVVGFDDANSREFDELSKHKVIDIMQDQKKTNKKGGTMRLGAYPCKLVGESRSERIYGQDLIYERHRHRYEFNNEYRECLKDLDLKIVGMSPDEKLVEMVELNNHSWYVGVQFHPEFKSRPNRPHPLFFDFIKSSLESKNFIS